MQNNVPPFMVFTEEQVKEIAQKKPRNKAEFQNIHGVNRSGQGEIKADKYGEAFIRAKKSDWLKVVLNSDFTGVYFDGEKIRADKQVKIVQSCSSETTLDNIFDSFNDTFSNK